jgi:FtsZ-interacting cell division protein YlmF
VDYFDASGLLRSRESRVPRSGTVRLIAAHPASDADAVTVVRPAVLGEVAEVARALEGGAPVMVDLDDLDGRTRQRAFDTLSGIAYAFDARLSRVDRKHCHYMVAVSGSGRL